MKPRYFRNALPATVISFLTVTKEWIVSPVDAPESVMYGFPWPYSCTGWHTSLSRQFFILEFLADFLFYYVFWLLILSGFGKFFPKFAVSVGIQWVLIGVAAILTGISVLLILMPENTFDMTRNFDISIVRTNLRLF